MSIKFFSIALLFWVGSIVLALNRRGANQMPARLILSLGCIFALVGVFVSLSLGTTLITLPIKLIGQPIQFQLNVAALWLMGFGLIPAVFACYFGCPIKQAGTQRYWLMGASCSLIGALGVFGLQDTVSFLISWELMSLGSAIMILGENPGVQAGRSVLFMLALLEVGAVALLIALLLLSKNSPNFAFIYFMSSAHQFSPGAQFLIGVLLVIGFGAKLGLLPFYEWLPDTYGVSSGVTGVLLSGIILNAAFFGLLRAILEWLPHMAYGFALGIFIVVIAVISAVLTILHAFQQSDWRRLLSFSSAENAAIAITTLGASLLFRQDNLFDLAALAATVSLLHLAAHSLAKGGLFLVADGVFYRSGNYLITQNGLLKHSSILFGIGALFAVMSLSAMPPQSGFVSEWFVFQTIFQGFHLTNLTGRLTLIFAGAGLALTAAIALATFIKVFGVGLQGAKTDKLGNIPHTITFAVFILGLLILALAVGMPIWLSILVSASYSWFGITSVAKMHAGWLLVPLSANFAFISPSLLVIVTPLLAIIPIALLLINRWRYPVRQENVWFGGLPQQSQQVATTALTFSNAMRTFYSFIYRPIRDIKKEYQGKPYFVKTLLFSQQVTSVFSVYLFLPVIRAVYFVAGKVRILQSGSLNFYSALIGILFVVILGLVLIQ